MHIQLSRAALAALALAIGASGFSTGNGAEATDACAGQSWPTYSQTCLNQVSGNVSAGELHNALPPAKIRRVSVNRK